MHHAAGQLGSAVEPFTCLLARAVWGQLHTVPKSGCFGSGLLRCCAHSRIRDRLEGAGYEVVRAEDVLPRVQAELPREQLAEIEYHVGMQADRYARGTARCSGRRDCLRVATCLGVGWSACRWLDGDKRMGVPDPEQGS